MDGQRSNLVVVAFAGGPVSSALVARHARGGRRVLAVTIDLAGLDDEAMQALAARARALGAESHRVIDAREHAWKRHLAWLVKGNLLEGGLAPPVRSAERDALASCLAAAAREAGAGALAHGLGAEDAARLDVALRVLAPGVLSLAAARDEGLTPALARAWLSEHGLGTSVTAADPRASAWGALRQGGELDDPWHAPDDGDFPGGEAPWEAAELPEEFDVDFEAGLPVSVFGRPADGPGVARQLDKIARRHGVGRALVAAEGALGVPRRCAVSVGAALVLVHAHRALEALVLTATQRLVKDQVGLLYADLLRRGLYHEPAARDIEALFDASQRFVAGTARLRLYRGGVEVLAARSPHALVLGDGPAGFDGRDARGLAAVLGAACARAARRAPIPDHDDDHAEDHAEDQESD